MKKMTTLSRILTAIASLALIACYFVPVWFIFLLAPQYPEGLTMQIWLNKLSGEVDIINGLNHYIGMKRIEASMFPEFNYLVYAVGFFILLGLTTAITGSRKLLFGYIMLAVAGAVAAIVDFYQWGYDYGHHLDPHAAIQVPGLTYQPPLIGHKKLLNFDAYSYPDTGGWIVIISTVIIATIWFHEWRKNRRSGSVVQLKAKPTVIAAVFLSVLLTSCRFDVQPIAYGKDACDECRMTIMDPKFGGEIVTKKGRVYKFDDYHCMAAFLKKGAVSLDAVGKMVFLDYGGQHEFIPVRKAWFVVSSKLQSPMAGHAAAFPGKAAAEEKAKEIDGRVTDWATLYNILIK